MAKKPFLKLRRLYEDEGLLRLELSEPVYEVRWAERRNLKCCAIC